MRVIRFLGPGTSDHHRLGNKSKADSGKHLHCGKCSIGFKDEPGLEGHVVENPEHVVFPERAHEFHMVEA